MQRPVSIVWFERCYLGAMAVGLLNTALSWQATTTKMAESPGADQFGPSFGPDVLIVGTLFGIGISLLLWYFAARKGAAVAKWIITVFFVLGVLGLGFSALMRTFPEGVSGVLGVVGFVLNAIAVWQLFRPDTEAWFGETPTGGPAA